MEHLNSDLSSKLRGANFFVAGGECMKVGLNLNYIPGKGVNLSDTNQTLQESFSTAKQIFEHVAPKTIKFVLIGLEPNSGDDADNFLTKDDLEKKSPILEEYCKLCTNNGARPVVVTFPVDPTLQKTLDAGVLQSLRNTVAALAKKYKAVFINLLEVRLAVNRFQSKWHLNARGTAEASNLLAKELYLKGVISAEEFLSLDKTYRKASTRLQDDYRAQAVRIFCDMACKDFKRLSATLPVEECKNLMATVFSAMNYNHLANLSDMLPKDDYNDIAARVFEISAEKIRRKDKVKIGFVLYDSSMWSGDDLYNLFAQDERFEVTVFLSQRPRGNTNESMHKDFLKSIELFQAHGLNVVAMKSLNTPVPPQDVLILLTPYFERLPRSVSPLNLPVSTLMTHLIYSFAVSIRSKQYYNLPIFRIAWKVFFPSTINLKMYGDNNPVGMPRGLYSGYPRMDPFLKKDSDFHFEWKMARPGAKKIIWAPHHSITDVSIYWATFQFNYKFMYEFAKAHPEISWVVKPHPNLAYTSVKFGVLPSVEAFEKYMQAWNDLPNAMVYTGAYYQNIFATSDGMIHDCGSFTAEYQYVDKPMIRLTREGARINELGNAILDASYCVDGKDLDGIAALIQRVFIEGDDYKAAERKVVFDKYMNYPKANGMFASEFIYKSIADEVTAPTKK